MKINNSNSNLSTNFKIPFGKSTQAPKSQGLVFKDLEEGGAKKQKSEEESALKPKQGLIINKNPVIIKKKQNPFENAKSPK